MTGKTGKEEVKLELCKILNKIGAVQFGAFRLTSGKLSPYYIDLRLVPSFPDAFQKICAFYVDLIRQEIGVKNIDRIAGVPVAGLPFASVVAYQLQKPFFYIRKGTRLHGRQKRVEGVVSPGDHVLLIDDLVTTGLSLCKAAKAIAAEGGVVSDAVVLIDRQEGGKEKLERAEVKLHTLLSMSEIVDLLQELGTLDEQQAKIVLKQIRKRK